MKAERSKPVLWTIPWAFAACLLCTPAQAKYGGGAGTADDPYQIRTPEQMNAIGADPNDWDKHFKLMADIDLGQYSADEFNIIGYSRGYPDHKPFLGVFDGNWHTISNFTWSSDRRGYVGLFGYVGNPAGFLGHWKNLDTEIRNIGLIHPSISAGDSNDIGSLVGYMSYASITHCYVRDIAVSGRNRVGGLIGSRTGGSVTACYSTGAVAGEVYAGGLIGYNDGSVTNCYSWASVHGEWSVGGLVGDNARDGTIVTCYSSGAVSGAYCGGLSGSNGGAVIGSYWDTETSGQAKSDGGSGKRTREMHRAATFTGWTPGDDERAWTIDEGTDYPRLYWENRPGSTLAGVRLGDLLKGEGTEDSPFLVGTAEELNLIGQFPYDWDKYFRLVADVDLSQYAGTEFNIIGAYGLPFAGSFDGDHHVVSNFNYTRTHRAYVGLFGCISGPNAEVRDVALRAPNINSGEECLGSLAGQLAHGTVAGCTVKDAIIYGLGNVGGLIGYNSSGVITNCHTTGTVEGRFDAGGLTCYNGGVLRDCSSIGMVIADTYAGGLVEFNGNYGTIESCCSAGSVTGGSCAGGLAAYNSFYGTVTNCYSSSDVTGIRDTGGLVGCNDYHSAIVNCYAGGKVTGKEFVGGLVGRDDHTETSVKASYWDVVATGQTASAAGTGKTTAELQMAKTFLDAGWDFVDETENGTEDVWWIDEGRDYPRLWWEAVGDPNSFALGMNP